jgi:hypothetical protein
MVESKFETEVFPIPLKMALSRPPNSPIPYELKGEFENF